MKRNVSVVCLIIIIIIIINIIKEMPGSVASGTLCISLHFALYHATVRVIQSPYHVLVNFTMSN